MPLSASARERLEAVFAPADRAAAEHLLAAGCGDNLPFCESATPESAQRIRYAVLELSRGSLAELRELVERAQTDWRDVLVWAGFGDDLDAHLRWRP